MASPPAPAVPAATAAAVVGVRMTFSVTQPAASGDGEKRPAPERTHVFECTTPLEAVPPRATAPPQDWPPYAPGSSAFSGRHDGGLLPPLQEGGPYGAILEAVAAARRDGDTHMTGVIRAGGGVVKSAAGEGLEEEEEGEEEEQGDGEGEEDGDEDGKVLVGVGGKGRGAKKPKI